MKLWILEPVKVMPANEEDPWIPWYDKTMMHVVRAETEEDARKLANEAGGDERGPVSHIVYRSGGDPWLDAKFSTCVQLTGDGPAEVIITDTEKA